MEIEVKDKIVISARDFFTRYGFKKTTMDDVAKNIHKAKGVIYYYFKSKEELFHESLAAEVNETKAAINEALSNCTNAADKLKAYVLTRGDYLANAKIYHETIKAEINERYVFVKDILTDFDSYERKLLTEIITEGSKAKSQELANINSTVNLMLLSIKSMETPFYLHNEYEKHRETLIELADIVLDALRNRT